MSIIMKKTPVKTVLIVAELILAVMLLMQSGCGRPKAPANMPRAFVAEKFDGIQPGTQLIHPTSKYATFDKELQGLCVDLPALNNKDYAQLAANRAMIEYSLGKPHDAAQSAYSSQRVMRGDVKGEQAKAAKSAIGSQAELVYKGEFYDDAMMNSMVGICNLMMGDLETARIGFRRALDADKRGKDKENFRDDFNLAHWGLGMADLDHDASNASVALKKAGYKDASKVKDENMVFVIFMGKTAWKLLKGLYGEQYSYQQSFCEPVSAEIFVDGKSLGKSVKLVNLYEQSQQVVFDAKAVGQGGKAVGKLVVAGLAGALLGDAGQSMVESGWNIKADNRTCYMLPNEVHAVSGKIKPGTHTVKVKFFGVNNVELKRYEQVWHYVVAPEKGRNYFGIRSEFDRCNVQGAIPFTRISKVKTRKIKETDTKQTTIKFRAANLPNLKVGDTLKVCHFFSRTEFRTCVQDNWRHMPMQYNNKGESIGYPDARFRMQDYDIGLVGMAEVTEISQNGEKGYARMTSMTTEYKPHVDDMVTAVKKQGRIWQ